MPIVVPNPAHAQFVPRGVASAREETKALTATRARQLMGMPAGDDLFSYHDRAILKVYRYTGIRLTTGCGLKASGFHQDGGRATLKFHEKGDKQRTIGLHFNAAQAIGEYVEKAGNTSGPLFRAQAVPRSREKMSSRPMDSAAIYRVTQGYLRRLPSAMKKEMIEDGSEVEYCVYTPHSLRATTATLLLDAGVDFKKAQKLTRTPAHHDDSDLRQAADPPLAGCSKPPKNHDRCYGEEQHYFRLDYVGVLARLRLNGY